MYKLKFKVTEYSEMMLKKLFDGIAVEPYTWFMLGWTELYNTKGNEHIPFFDEEYMSGIEFADKISDPVFPVMVHIGAFSNPNDHSDILSTKDFSVSKCELILVIYDTVYAEIYAKSMSLTDRFYSNIKGIAEDITLTEVSPDSTQIIY